MNGNYASCLPPSIVWISLNISGQKGQIGTSNKCDIQDTTEARHWHFPLLNAIRSPTFWGCKSEYLQPFNRLQKVPPSIGKKNLGGKNTHHSHSPILAKCRFYVWIPLLSEALSWCVCRCICCTLTMNHVSRAKTTSVKDEFISHPRMTNVASWWQLKDFLFSSRTFGEDGSNKKRLHTFQLGLVKQPPTRLHLEF